MSWTRIFWPALIGVFLIGEFWALLDGNEASQPFTNWSLDRFGVEAILTLLLWAVVHYGLRGTRKARGER